MVTETNPMKKEQSPAQKKKAEKEEIFNDDREDEDPMFDRN